MAYKKTTVSEFPIQVPLHEGMPVLVDDMSLSFSLGLSNKAMWYFQGQSRAHAGSDESCYSPISLAKRGRAGKMGKKRRAYVSTSKIQLVQKKICQTFLVHDVMGDHVGAYEPGKSTIDLARKCSGKKLVAQIDCKEFFPSIRLSWVRKLFESYGYSRYTASLLAGLLCTSEERRGGAKGPYTRRFLPQGGVASPLVSNRVANLRIDGAILALLEGSPWEYYRYSDNIYLTCEELLPRNEVDKVVKCVRGLIHRGGWKTHKVRVDTFWRQQKVLGLVVNAKANLPSRDFYALKATVHNCLNRGFSEEIARAEKSLGRHLGSPEALLAHLRGKLSYAKQVLHEDRYTKLRAKLKAAESKWFHQLTEEPLEVLTRQTMAALAVISGGDAAPLGQSSGGDS